MKPRVTLVFAILFVWLSIPSSAQSGSCSISTLPKGIADNIRAKYAGWRPEQISDLGSDDQQLWMKTHGQLCPGITSGHFESNGRLGYAVLLIKRNEANGGYKLLIFRSNSSGGFLSAIVAHAEGKLSSGPVISRVPAGEYSDPETGKSVKTKLDSVLVEWIEAAAQLYYWSGSRYRKLQVQD